ncbi:MAG TPA: TylF/MycF/NovP-related O-methyltransferase [Burkholderiales bacterium]|nr:TylF/MycF/NovP-related O-methyltransferase [Burkholderiales bacterium]
MDLQEIRRRIAALDNTEIPVSREEFESFCNRVIAELPRNAETGRELRWAYEQLIQLRVEEGRPARAMRVFRQYLGDCAPVCTENYDQLYQAGLLATHTPSTPLRRRDRFYSLVQLFQKTLSLDGMIAECGCFRGLSSYVLCSTLKLANNAFDGAGYRVFDSFAGLSAPQPEDSIVGTGPDAEQLRQMTRPGQYAATLDKVKGALAAFPGIEYFPGWIPQAFPDESNVRYRFVHVDVDIYQPTRDSIEYFYPRLVPGGILVSDDYNWPGARKAIEEFCSKTGAAFEVTPYTQAYIVRRM